MFEYGSQGISFYITNLKLAMVILLLEFEKQYFETSLSNSGRRLHPKPKSGSTNDMYLLLVNKLSKISSNRQKCKQQLRSAIVKKKSMLFIYSVTVVLNSF